MVPLGGLKVWVGPTQLIMSAYLVLDHSSLVFRFLQVSSVFPYGRDLVRMKPISHPSPYV